MDLLPDEKRLFKRLSTASRIQDYLDSIPINHEYDGETLLSPREVIRQKHAHCIEAALLAVAVFRFHKKKAYLLDLKTTGLPEDYDHVVALFKEKGCWGAISKTNHSVLRYRDPVYKSVRELVMSYFHEYFIVSGKKTLRSYSRPFQLPRSPWWITTSENLWQIAEALDASPHIQLVTPSQIKMLRKASVFERTESVRTEWKARK